MTDKNIMGNEGKRIRIVNETGHGRDTKVYCKETGEPLDKVRGICGIKFNDINGTSVIMAEIEWEALEFDITAELSDQQVDDSISEILNFKCGMEICLNNSHGRCSCKEVEFTAWNGIFDCSQKRTR